MTDQVTEQAKAAALEAVEYYLTDTNSLCIPREHWPAIVAALQPAPSEQELESANKALDVLLEDLKRKSSPISYERLYHYVNIIRTALSQPEAQAVDVELAAAMGRVIAIAKSYKADESAGGNYKGANESNRRAIEYAESFLASGHLRTKAEPKND